MGEAGPGRVTLILGMRLPASSMVIAAAAALHWLDPSTRLQKYASLDPGRELGTSA